jgi:NAD+ kinase
MTTTGILYHPNKAQAQPLAAEVAAWLEAQGGQTWIGADWEAEDLAERLASLSLLVVLGGDGTTLRAARLAAPYQVPVFGINLGRVGFLSEATPDAWQEKLGKVLRGEFWLEQRLMLQATLQRGDERLYQAVALNDVVVSRGAAVRLVRFHLYLDGDFITTYAADAMIAATPTGSTAYSLAAGGPVLPPQLQNFLVLPVAPHLTLERAIVLHQEAVVSLQVETEYEAVVSADGQEAVGLQNGDQVMIEKHPYKSCFARVENSSYFYHRLIERLGYWNGMRDA